MTTRHELKIIHERLIAVRPFGIVCTCGFKGAAETYAEAERVVKSHQEREAQQQKIKERELLK